MADSLPQSETATTEAVPRPVHGIVRSLARSFAVYGSANFGIRGLNFLLIVLYAHYLQPYDYGVVYMAEIVASFVVIFSGLSIDNALQRLYFQHLHDAEELHSYLGSAIRFGLIWMVIFLGLVVTLGSSVQAHLSPRASVPFFPYVVMAIATATGIQGVQFRLAVYQASSRPRSYASLSFALFILTAACCVYGVVIRRNGAIGMLAGKLVAAAIIFVFAVWSMRAFLAAPFQWKYVRESLSFGLPLIPHLVMASGLVVADRFIVEHYRGLTEVGIYSLAYTFGMVMFLVTQSLSQAWLPMFFELASGNVENRELLGRICSGLAIFLVALACLGILLSPLFVHLSLDYRYRAAARVVPLVVMGYLFHALFSLFDLSILHAKRTASVFLISLLAFTVNLALNFAMIPRWGMYGAAWATTIAYGVEAAAAFFLAQSFFTLPYRVHELLAGIAVASGALWLTQLAWTPGLLLALAPVVALGLLALIGRRDLQSVFLLMRSARDRDPRRAS
jgi:O-antigen/teichoic acid export membrane protein